MVRNTKIKQMVIAALLCAIGIVIPMFFPKIWIPPMSFTLASHVPVILAVFISPGVALAVALGTTIGFFFSGLPYIVVLRAVSHLAWVIIGALWLKQAPAMLQNMKKAAFFGFVLALIHGVSEALVVTWFYFGGQVTDAYYQAGYFRSVVLLVGIGTVVHAMIDFTISMGIWKILSKQIKIPVSAKA